ncbi:Rab GTPase [Vairimorpha necatrix]|uniref:Rab GTPase n=1 Tax=Vairimorpha necatrix TaxID=6039 RepID=A0AAX4JEI2_9MICR
MSQAVDHKFKFILLGESNVGKTALLRKYKTDDFQESLMSTIGIDTITKKIFINKKPILLEIWDTAGQERFFSITKSYYRNADGIFLVFDLSVENTLKSVDRWYKTIENAEDVPIFLIGNKRDLISDSVHESIKSRLPGTMKYFSTSAKYGLNVSKIFEEMGKILLKKNKKKKTVNEKIVLNKKSKRRTCC